MWRKPKQRPKAAVDLSPVSTGATCRNLGLRVKPTRRQRQLIGRWSKRSALYAPSTMSWPPSALHSRVYSPASIGWSPSSVSHSPPCRPIPVVPTAYALPVPLMKKADSRTTTRQPSGPRGSKMKYPVSRLLAAPSMLPAPPMLRSSTNIAERAQFPGALFPLPPLSRWLLARSPRNASEARSSALPSIHARTTCEPTTRIQPLKDATATTAPSSRQPATAQSRGKIIDGVCCALLSTGGVYRGRRARSTQRPREVLHQTPVAAAGIGWLVP